MTHRFGFLRRTITALILEQNVTLPTATLGQPYSQSIASYVTGGQPTLTFRELIDAGNGGFAMSSAGLITGSPAVPALLTDPNGDYFVDQSGDVYTT
jgi:hypothetical protein